MATVPTPKMLMRPTLEALKALGGSGSIQEIFQEILEQQKYPREVIEVMSPNDKRPKLEYRSHWARTLLKYVGAAENIRQGVWALTPYGLKMSDEEMFERLKKHSSQRQKSAKKKQKKKKAELDAVEKQDEFALEVNWKDDLLDKVKGISPSDFERLSQQLLRIAGFIDVNVTGSPGDGGIDGTGILRMNLVSFRVLFQCKRYDGSVSANTVRDFRGAMQGRADRGLIITTGTFTPAAKAEATRDGAPLIDLIDGDEFCDLLKKNRLGVKIEMVESITVDDEWFKKNF